MREEHLETGKTEREPLSSLVLRNLDMLAAVAGLALLGLCIAGVLLAPSPEVPTTLDACAAEETALEERLADRFEMDSHEERVKSAADQVRGGWGGVEEPAEVGEGITHPRELLALLRRGETNEIFFPAPEWVRGDAEPGVVALAWSVHEDNNVDLSGFLLRKQSPEGAWTDLAQVAARVHEFADKDVQAGYSYTYTVTALTTDPAVAGQADRSLASPPKTVRAVPDFKIELQDADETSQEATFKVEKWHEGAWWPKKFTQKQGGSIGAKDPGSGVDYATPRVLQSLVFKEETRTLPRLEVVFDETAKVRLEGGNPVTERVVVTETFTRVTATLEGGGLPASTLDLEKR